MAAPPRDATPAIGSLRWPVTIAQRAQAADSVSTGIAETYRDIMDVRADIQPIEAMTFYAGMQVDSPTTHAVTIRWLDWIDTTHVIQRKTYRTDGSVRTEMFRIRRVQELAGRKRFLLLECEQERRD
jgi:hypothetical protein